VEIPIANGKINEVRSRHDERNGRASDHAVREQADLARAAQPGWALRPLAERLAVVRRLRHLVARDAAAIADVLGASRGRLPAEVLAGEVLPLADACRFLERSASAILRPRRLRTIGRPLWLAGVRSEVRREPLGLVLVIGPGNYPLLLPGVQAVQALVAGNGVLIKPGEFGSVAATRIRELCVEAGLPPDLLQILPEEPCAAEAAIASGVDKVMLTGSAATGAKVLGLLASRLVPATMELSGCDAAFVRADADLELAARALRFGLAWNGGATCIAPRRVFVAEQVAGALERALVAAMEQLPASRGCARPAPRAAALVRDAVDRGARLVIGGHPDDHGAAPTVLADARVEMPLLREDVLAPVLALVSVRDDEDALLAAAQCPYALGATVFGNERPARDFAARVCAGVVVINDVIVPTADPRLPFGGRKRSGFGLTRGAEGLLELTAAKVIIARRGTARWHLDGLRSSDEAIVHHYIRAVHAGTWRARLAAWRSLVSHLLGRRSGESAGEGVP
jgi:acyl-CoA reductase-like NAD-dependent aldehyde dehydrogenase